MFCCLKKIFHSNCNKVKIKSVQGLEVIDSRGNPTVEAIVELTDGTLARAISPSGASTGTKEAFELRDNDKTRFLGKGVQKAVININGQINSILSGLCPFNQKEIDEELIKLDGTKNKSNIGANAILAVSIAVAKASAMSKKLSFFEYLKTIAKAKNNNFTTFCNNFKTESKTSAKIGLISIKNDIMPMPMMNIINGGAHADNNLEIQEFMIIPSSAKTIADAVRMGCEVFANLKKILASQNLAISVGDEGGFAPKINTSKEALNLIIQSITQAGYKSGIDINIALDCAASEFFKDGKYHVDGLSLTTDELISYYKDLISNYPIISIEDPFSENDTDGFIKLTKECGDKIQIVGDDAFCTNPEILSQGISKGVANALLVKPNQIGTLTETMQAVEMARKNGYNTILSHRSGESEDTSIAHIAVALRSGQIKTGSLSRTDRTAKYNELIRIENFIKNSI